MTDAAPESRADFYPDVGWLEPVTGRIGGAVPDSVMWPTQEAGHMGGHSPLWSDQRAINALRGHVWTAVNAAAERVSAMQFRLVAVDTRRDGEEEEVGAHPFLDMMRRPNKWTTGRKERWKLAASMQVSGRWYWRLIRGFGGVPIGFWPMHPENVRAVPGRTSDDFIREWLYWPDGVGRGKPDHIPVEDVVPFDSPSLEDDWYGFPRMKAGARDVNASDHLRAYQERFFENQGYVSQAVLTKIDGGAYDAQTQLEVAEARVRRFHRGRRGWGGTMVLPDGSDVKSLQHNFREMMFPDLDQRTAERIFEVFGFPKGLAGHTDSYNRANIDGIQTIYAQQTIEPLAWRIADILTCFLVEPNFTADDGILLEVRPPENIVPRDREYELKKRQALHAAGRPLNEWLREEGLDEVEGGDVPLVSAGLMPIEDAGLSLSKAAPAPAPEPDPDDEDEEDDESDEGRSVVPASCIQRARQSRTPEGREVLWRQAARGMDSAERIVARSSRVYFRRQWERISADLEANLRPLVERTHGMPKRERQRQVKAWKRDEGDVLLGGLWDQGEEERSFVQAMRAAFRAALSLGLDYAAGFVGLDFDVTRPEASVWLANHESRVAGQVTSTTRRAIARAVGAGISEGESIRDISARVRAVFVDADRSRSLLIARTETTQAYSAAAQMAWEAPELGGEVVGQTWVTSRDGLVRDSHAALDGETVRLGQAFSDGQTGPGEPNCRCILAPQFRSELGAGADEGQAAAAFLAGTGMEP